MSHQTLLRALWKASPWQKVGQATRVYFGQTQDIGVGGAVSDRCLDRQAMRCWLRRIVLFACRKKWSRTIFHIRLIDT